MRFLNILVGTVITYAIIKTLSRNLTFPHDTIYYRRGELAPLSTNPLLT